MKKISIISLLLVVVASFAQTYTIKLNLKKGETYSSLIDVKMDMLQKVMGQEIPIKMNLSVAYSYKVLGIDKDLYTLEGKYNYIGNNVEAMGRNMKMASNTNDENPINKMFAGMINVPFTLKVKDNGDVAGVEGYEKVVEAMKNALPENMREMLSKEFGKSFSKDQVAQSLKSAFFAIPPKAVNVGDTWDAVYTAQNNGVEMLNKMSCKLESVDKKSYKISYTGNLAAKEGGSVEQNGMKMDVKKIDGKMDGSLVLDKDSAWVKNNDSKGKINMQMEMKMGDQTVPMESMVDMIAVATDASMPNLSTGK